MISKTWKFSPTNPQLMRHLSQNFWLLRTSVLLQCYQGICIGVCVYLYSHVRIFGGEVFHGIGNIYPGSVKNGNGKHGDSFFPFANWDFRKNFRKMFETNWWTLNFVKIWMKGNSGPERVKSGMEKFSHFGRHVVSGQKFFDIWGNGPFLPRGEKFTGRGRRARFFLRLLLVARLGGTPTLFPVLFRTFFLGRFWRCPRGSFELFVFLD